MQRESKEGPSRTVISGFEFIRREPPEINPGIALFYAQTPPIGLNIICYGYYFSKRAISMIDEHTFPEEIQEDIGDCISYLKNIAKTNKHGFLRVTSVGGVDDPTAFLEAPGDLLKREEDLKSGDDVDEIFDKAFKEYYSLRKSMLIAKPTSRPMITRNNILAFINEHQTLPLGDRHTGLISMLEHFCPDEADIGKVCRMIENMERLNYLKTKIPDLGNGYGIRRFAIPE